MISTKKIVIIVLLLIISLFNVIFALTNKTHIELNCLSPIVTNILIPMTATRIVYKDVLFRFQLRPCILGALLGVIFGSIPATIFTASIMISYYNNRGDLTTDISKMAFATIFSSFIVWWFVLLSFSACAGVIMAIRLRKSSNTK